MLLLIVGISLGSLAIVLLVHELLERRSGLRNSTLKKHRLGIKLLDGKDAPSVKALLQRTPLKSLLVREAKRKATASFERDLPACLEVIALGMQAGLGFDQAFALYTERFDNLLAKRCQQALSVWQRGLKSRDVGLRELADDIGTTSFKHFSFSVVRALRFGSPMTPLLLSLAQEARKEYRARRQEVVAKAPVKMLLPTGTLILPAMLLLVMGPIILDLLRKMG